MLVKLHGSTFVFHTCIVVLDILIYLLTMAKHMPLPLIFLLPLCYTSFLGPHFERLVKQTAELFQVWIVFMQSLANVCLLFDRMLGVMQPGFYMKYFGIKLAVKLSWFVFAGSVLLLPFFLFTNEYNAVLFLQALDNVMTDNLNTTTVQRQRFLSLHLFSSFFTMFIFFATVALQILLTIITSCKLIWLKLKGPNSWQSSELKRNLVLGSLLIGVSLSNSFVLMPQLMTSVSEIRYTYLTLLGLLNIRDVVSLKFGSGLVGNLNWNGVWVVFSGPLTALNGVVCFYAHILFCGGYRRAFVECTNLNKVWQVLKACVARPHIVPINNVELHHQPVRLRIGL